LYLPRDANAEKQAPEFKRFGRQAEKGTELRAGAVNCDLDGNLCQRYWQLLQMRRPASLYLIIPDLQPDEQFATDVEVFDEERYGYPSAKELDRQARKVAAHEIVQADGAFFEQNITKNPLVKEPNVTSTTVWFVWFYHSERCSKVDACDKTAPGMRKLSIELQGVARVAAINCKKHKHACKGHLGGGEATTVRVFVQRQNKHFVQSFALDAGGGAGGHSDTMAVAGATSILKFLVQPGLELRYPPHPFRPAVGTSSASEVSGSTEDLRSVDLSKLKVGQLKEILRQHGASCVGCADKSEFVAKVREVAGLPLASSKSTDEL